MLEVGPNITQVDTNPQFAAGEIYAPGGSNKAYKYVKYVTGAGSIAAVAGNVVGYYAPAGDFAAEGYTSAFVTSDVSDALTIAGVLQAAPANNQWCWIQIRGPATLTTAPVSGADGQPLVLSTTTDGTVKVAALATDAIGAMYAQDISDKTVILNCPW